MLPPSHPQHVVRDHGAHPDGLPVLDHGAEPLGDVASVQPGAEGPRSGAAGEADHHVHVGVGRHGCAPGGAQHLHQLRARPALTGMGRGQEDQGGTEGGEGCPAHDPGNHTGGPPGWQRRR